MNDETKVKLEAPLDRSAVSTLSFGGRNLSYLEGWYMISAANGIFGFDGWSHEVLSIEHMGNGLYMARVRVEVLGVSRVDVGTSTARSDAADAHETAIKGAATDGLKRALRTFGAQFGNDLYDTGAGQSAPQAAPSRPAQRPQERATAAPPANGGELTNLGQLLTWASTTHKLMRNDVIALLGVDSLGDIAPDFEAARQAITEKLAVPA